MIATRSHRTPLSIWFIAVAWSLVDLVTTTIQLRPSHWVRDGLALAAIVLLSLALTTYKAVALIRLSRWPVLLALAGITWSVTARCLAHFDWRGHYPMLGIFAFLFPMAVLLACTLPHWRKMNWGLFGRPYRRPDDQVEAFA